jgi:hypothetical protein
MKHLSSVLLVVGDGDTFVFRNSVVLIVGCYSAGWGSDWYNGWSTSTHDCNFVLFFEDLKYLFANVFELILNS